jgi:pantothenate kinase-related protein Tda10
MEEGGNQAVAQFGQQPLDFLQPFPQHVSFDHGFFLTVRAIQELRAKKQGSVFVGIGGPSGSGKSRCGNLLDLLHQRLLFLAVLHVW